MKSQINLPWDTDSLMEGGEMEAEGLRRKVPGAGDETA